MCRAGFLVRLVFWGYMKKIQLSNRLKAIADFVRPGAHVADIGTDHGHIPVYLSQNGGCRSIVASDIRSGPLEKAVASATEYGVQDQISFVLAPGLAGVSPAEVDTVLIAGMGGETILSILSDAPWTKTCGIDLILQPQSKIPELQYWLRENGYRICDGCLAEDEEKLYIVLLVRPGRETDRTPAGLYVNRVLFANRDPLLPKYITALQKKTEHALAGLERAVDARASARQTLELLRLELLHMWEETEKWQQ